MPGFNGTGPLSEGPMTGRGGGYCMSYVVPDAGFNQSFRRINRRPRHRYHTTGLCSWSRWPSGSMSLAPVYAPPLDSGQELSFLKEQAENMENALEQVKKRIKELKTKADI